MNNSFQIKRFLPHIAAFGLFLLLSLAYFTPVLNDMVLNQYDVMQVRGSQHELIDHYEQTGKRALWTNSMFGGMPAYLVSMDYPNSWTTQLGRLFTGILPAPANYAFLYLIGFYIFLSALRFNPWLSIIGALGFGFASYNFINIEAGHLSKALAIAYCAPILGGVILAFRGRYFIGGAITGIFLGLELYANHPQITYYLFIAIAMYAGFEFFAAFKEKRVKPFFIATLVLGIAGILSVGTHASRLWTVAEYSPQTIRGKSELTSNTQSTGGLDRDYAFRWSYGIMETMTFLIPDFYGGGSAGSLKESSETYKLLTERGVDKKMARSFVKQMPLYWGPQPMTSGPVYFGAIMCFLFVLGFFTVKNYLKWWVLAVVVLFTMLSWGKNFPILNDPFFDYFPMYNKFRAVTMILAVVDIFVCFFAIWGLREFISAKIPAPDLNKYLRNSFFIVGGILLFFAVLGGSLFDFQKPAESDEGVSQDTQFLSGLERSVGNKQFAEDIYSALLDDRAGLLQKDAFISFAFVLGAAALLWAFLNKRIVLPVALGGIAVLVLGDMWRVSKRYLGDDDFISRRKFEKAFPKSDADETILNDKDPDFRVLNMSTNPWADATTSYYHKSLGGYHGAKLRRYQELIENHMSSPLSMPVINMLNTKYFITENQGRVLAQRNPQACGNAWFVKEYQIVPDADKEIAALKEFDPLKTAVVDQRFKKYVDGKSFSADSSGFIKLTKYSPDELTYESNASSEQLAVFSEIYYNDKLGWKAYVDGKEVEHFRVDYVLRAMVVPAGKHTIVFRFDPQSYKTGEMISLISSILLLAGVIAGVFFSIKRKGGQPVEAEVL